MARTRAYGFVSELAMDFSFVNADPYFSILIKWSWDQFVELLQSWLYVKYPSVLNFPTSQLGQCPTHSTKFLPMGTARLVGLLPLEQIPTLVVVHHLSRMKMPSERVKNTEVQKHQGCAIIWIDIQWNTKKRVLRRNKRCVRKDFVRLVSVTLFHSFSERSVPCQSLLLHGDVN